MQRAERLAGGQFSDAVTDAGIADSGLLERHAGGEVECHVSLPGLQVGDIGAAFVIAGGIGHGGIEDDIGSHRTFQCLDGDAHHQGLMIRVGENILDDDKAALLIGIGQAIGG